ncbi:hypothetical protein DSO57_1026762 [Entomophthora muscae]|uniref:Uncharacterized protein n=1 Tax=Entomophthora muscae TaxID=34485 RepID=A0ACC2RT66_9FUNG|nr:hypothetical protein DSO57_1026762 [Entomophthora muscae]
MPKPDVPPSPPSDGLMDREQKLWDAIQEHCASTCSQGRPADLPQGNCGKFDSLKLDSLVLDKVSSPRESSAAYVHLLGFKTKNQGWI